MFKFCTTVCKCGMLHKSLRCVIFQALAGLLVSIYKKGDKNKVSNYRPISLLPVFGNFFEKILYDNLYKYLNENNLFLSNQSGFRKGDSCVNQLLAITHEIYQGFDCSLSVETRGVFLDMSKAFDKVWHEGTFIY